MSFTRILKQANAPQIVKLEKEIARLEKLAYHDFLLGAYNRRGFLKASQIPYKMALQSREYNRRQSDKTRDLCLMLFDIDNFKHYNDTYSYAMGDNVLKLVSYYFGNYVRKTDVFGRWGGDEFILLLPFTTMSTALKLTKYHKANFPRVAIKLIQKNKKYLDKWTNREAVTFSMGLASLDKEKTILALLNKANRGLKLAKKKKNAIVVAK